MTDDHRAILERLFPAARSFVSVGEGWTCHTYEVDGAWIVQLPRNTYAADRLRFQTSFLPELAREVSALVPVPERVDVESPVLVYRRLDGAAADHAPEGMWPERLGRFLYDLHSVPPEYVGLRSTTPSALRDAEREAWAGLRRAIDSHIAPTDLTALDDHLADLLDVDANWSFAPVLTHGDLGPEHVLVGGSGDLVGVLDWEEAGLGDPAGDLAWWLHERPAQGERALAAYGGAPDRRFRERARLRWALMPWHEVHHGVANAQPAFVESGLVGVRARAISRAS